MKKTFLLILILVSFFSVSCSTDVLEPDNPEVEDSFIKLRVYYTKTETGNQKYYDFGSKIYVYYDMVSMNFADFEYQGNGIFKKDRAGLEIIPDQNELFEFLTDDYLLIPPLYLGKTITLFIESNQYQGLNTFYTSLSSYNIEHTVVFSP